QLFLIRQNSPLVLPTTSPNYASYYNFQPYAVVFASPTAVTYIPQIDFDDTLSPTPTSDIQTLNIGSGWNPGDTFTITILTDTTGPITYAGDDYTNAGSMAGVTGAT